MRVMAIFLCAMIPGLQVYIFRRIRDDLIKNHLEGPKGFRAMLAGWQQCGLCKIVDDEIRFWNGAKIYLCHCKDEKDIYKYQGAEIHVLLIDELTHFTEAMYRYLRMRVRMIGLDLPPQFKGLLPRILCGANPGNVGHLWVKRTFVSAAPPMVIRQMEKSEGGMLRQYIPARLEDNPSLMEDDPTYEDRLEGAGSAALVKAMRHGDWDVIDGAFFNEWDNSRHVIEPFAIPRTWLRNASADWGSAKPFSFGWWAIVPDPYKTPGGVWLPRGCLVRYREWYGVHRSPDGQIKEDVGLKLHADEVGRQLWEIEKTMPAMANRVMDPAAFAENGGPSIVENIYRGSGNRVKFRKADNTRVARDGAMGGWDQFRARLKGDLEGRPMAVWFNTCTDSIRTIPALQHDGDNPEDLDSTMEDHAADETRYEFMSRPWSPSMKNPPAPKMRGINEMTIDELLSRQVERAERI